MPSAKNVPMVLYHILAHMSRILYYFILFSEKGDVKAKTEALKRVIYQIINGDKMPALLMIIIRFVLPSQNHMIKKLLLIFWEIVPKLGPDGKLLQEMILVCDAYRKVFWTLLSWFILRKCGKWVGFTMTSGNAIFWVEIFPTPNMLKSWHLLHGRF